MIVMRRQINLKPLLIPFLKYGLMGIGMFVVVFVCTQHLEVSILKTIIQVCVGCIGYAGVALCIKDEVLGKILWEKSVV